MKPTDTTRVARHDGGSDRSTADLQKFFEALLATDVPFVWFLSTDSPGHRKVSPPGGFGGLWDENWDPKPAVDLLAGLR